MMIDLPDARRYREHDDFQEVRVDMVDQSTFVFGRVSAAIRFARKSSGQVIRFTIGGDEPIEQYSEVRQPDSVGATDSLFDGLFGDVGGAPVGQMPLGGVHPYNIDALAMHRTSGTRSVLPVGRWGVKNTNEVKSWERTLTATQRNSVKQVQKTLSLRRPLEYISVSVGFEGDLVVGASDILYSDVLAWLTEGGYERFDIHDGHPERLEYFRLRDGIGKVAA